MTAARIAAVILAGGRGERLGGLVKANLTIGGVRLIDRVTTAIAGSVSTILVAHGRTDPAALELGAAHIPIPDLEADYGGPLAGIAAAVAWCAAQSEPPHYILSVAVDTPFFPSDFVPRARAAIGPDLPGVVARYGAQDYPTDALWRLTGLLALPRQLAEGTAPRSLRRYATSIGAVPLDWPPDAAGDPFASLNTQEDRAALEGRAARPQPATGSDER